MSIRPNHREMLCTLQRHGVPFVIVGGVAVNEHGHIRSTEDVDVIWVRSPDHEAKLLSALTELGAQWIGSDIDPATGIERTHAVGAGYIQSRHLMMLWTRLGFLDLFAYVPGIPEMTPEQAYAESVKNPDGFRYVSKATLLAMKHAAGRTQDLEDVRRLELLTRPPTPPDRP